MKSFWLAHSVFSDLEPALPSGMPDRASWGSRNKRLRNWAPSPAGWGVWWAFWPWLCQMLPDTPFESFRQWLHMCHDLVYEKKKNKWIVVVYRFSQLARLLGRVENFVVEDREIQGEPEPDRVGGLHLRLADVVSVLVSFLRVIHNGCKLSDIWFIWLVGYTQSVNKRLLRKSKANKYSTIKTYRIWRLQWQPRPSTGSSHPSS